MTTTLPALTERQANVYMWMRLYFTQNDQLPPTRAIQQQFGWASQTAAMSHIRALVKKGYLERNAAGKFRFSRTGGVVLSDAGQS